MGMDYCTVEDVLSVAPIFRKDVLLPGSETTAEFKQNTNNISIEDVEYIISEASEMVRGILSPRYSIPVINAYSPSFPPVVAYITRTYAACIMYERYSSQSVERNETVINALKRPLWHQEQIILNGALLDATGVRVPTLKDPCLMKGTENDSFVTDYDLEELYEDGREY